MQVCLTTWQWTTDWYPTLIVDEWCTISASTSNSKVGSNFISGSNNTIPFLKLAVFNSKVLSKLFNFIEQELPQHISLTVTLKNWISLICTGLNIPSCVGPINNFWLTSNFPATTTPAWIHPTFVLKALSNKTSVLSLAVFTKESSAFIEFFGTNCDRKDFKSSNPSPVTVLTWKIGTKLPKGIFCAANSASFSDLTLKTDFCSPVFNNEVNVFIVFSLTSFGAISTFVKTIKKGIFNDITIPKCSLVILCTPILVPINITA